MLTVAPSDISEMGEGGSHHRHHHHHHHNNPSHPSNHTSHPLSSAAPTPKDSGALKGQLERLEGMYHDVVKRMGAERGVHGGRAAGRRWSIASSDTSSLRKGGRHARGASGSASATRPGKDLR